MSPRTAHPPKLQYVPGVCNIGPAERTRRRQGGIIGLIFALVLLAILLAIRAPTAWRLVLFLPTFIAATGLLQDALHFCAGFGMSGLFNVVHSAGVTTSVKSEEFRRRDRAKALMIFALSAGISATVAVGSMWL